MKNKVDSYGKINPDKNLPGLKSISISNFVAFNLTLSSIAPFSIIFGISQHQNSQQIPFPVAHGYKLVAKHGYFIGSGGYRMNIFVIHASRKICQNPVRFFLAEEIF